MSDICVVAQILNPHPEVAFVRFFNKKPTKSTLGTAGLKFSHAPDKYAGQALSSNILNQTLDFIDRH